jgi:hypothetical protein
MRTITLLHLREFPMMSLMVAAIIRIRKGLSFKWNLLPYKARDSIMQRVRKKILNSWNKMITSIVVVKYGHKTITPGMKTACHQFFFLGTERNL